MFYDKIDNLLITKCQHLVWRIELLTSMSQSSLARLIKYIHWVFSAILAFFVISVILEGSSSSYLLLLFIIFFIALHQNSLRIFKEIKNNKTAIEKEGEWQKPEMIVSRKQMREGMFPFTIFFCGLTIFSSPVFKGDTSGITILISLSLFLSPIVIYLSEFFFCVVPLPKNAREDIETERKISQD